MSALAEVELGICECETCRLIAALDLDRYRDTKERRLSLFTLKCVLLSPDLETSEALMRGERVPRSRLDREWSKAYGY